MIVPDIVADKLHQALQMTDSLAFANVTHDDHGVSILDDSGAPIKGVFPRGGPFGAAMAISYRDAIEIIGQPRGNNVVGSGIASRHAEDQAMLPDNHQALLAKLAAYKKAGEEVSVWMITSGQSCTNCHAKQEILARNLIGKRLIRDNGFTMLYGATFDETFRIAQFYDAQYADAMILFARDPQHAGNLIHAEKIEYARIPKEVQAIFSEAQTATAVVVRDGKPYSIGTDERSDINLYATAEVLAVRGACTRNRAEGVFISWEVDGELYTTASEMGPLLFAEMGWTKINRVHHVVMPESMKPKQFDTRETPGLSNGEFMRIIAGGYQDERAALSVLRDESFVNTAQPMWARVLKTNSEVLYNGAAVSDAALAERDLRTRFLFAAFDLHSRGKPPEQPKPLATLRSFMEQALR